MKVKDIAREYAGRFTTNTYGRWLAENGLGHDTGTLRDYLNTFMPDLFNALVIDHWNAERTGAAVTKAKNRLTECRDRIRGFTDRLPEPPVVLRENVTVLLERMMLDAIRESSPGLVGEGSLDDVIRDIEGRKRDHDLIRDWGPWAL